MYAGMIHHQGVYHGPDMIFMGVRLTRERKSMNDQKENPSVRTFSLYQYVHIRVVSPLAEVIMLAGDRRYESCKHRADHMTNHPYHPNMIQYLRFIRSSRGSVAK